MRRTVGAIRPLLILFLSAGCGTFHATTAHDTSVEQSTTQAIPASKPESRQVTFREELCRELVLWGPVGPIVYLMGFRLK